MTVTYITTDRGPIDIRELTKKELVKCVEELVEENFKLKEELYSNSVEHMHDLVAAAKIIRGIRQW